MSERTRGWWRFLGWAPIGACLTVGEISQLGILLLPLGLLAGGLAASRLYRPGRKFELLGLLVGAAGVGIVLGAMNLGYVPCRDTYDIAPTAPTVTYSCGGYDGTPWFVAGLALLTLVLLSYWILSRREQGDFSPGLS